MITGFKVYRYVDPAMVYDYMRDCSLIFNIPERRPMSGNYDEPGKPTPKRVPTKKKKK